MSGLKPGGLAAAAFRPSARLPAQCRGLPPFSSGFPAGFRAGVLFYCNTKSACPHPALPSCCFYFHISGALSPFAGGEILCLQNFHPLFHYFKTEKRIPVRNPLLAIRFRLFPSRSCHPAGRQDNSPAEILHTHPHLSPIFPPSDKSSHRPPG